MQIRAVVDVLEALAPSCHAEPWDNTGLLWGDPADAAHQVLLTNDCTHAVVEEAEQRGCSLIVSYHPPLFKAVKKLPARHVMHRALRAGIALYSPHTAWDAAPGGTNDRLCDALSLTGRAALRPAQAPPLLKLVFFAPAADTPKLTAALRQAGAGHIGRYSGCHFRSAGVGAFFPEAGSKPAIGRVGIAEEVDEMRVETVLPQSSLAAVVAALRAHHPYEEPAFDVFPTVPVAPAGVGMGRVGDLPQPLTFAAAVDLVKAQLRLAHVLVCPPPSDAVSRVAVCAGAGGEFVADAARVGAQVLVTGEVRHHDALAAQERGVAIIATLHSNSERLTLPYMAEALRARLDGVTLHVSKCDKDPLRVQ